MQRLKDVTRKWRKTMIPTDLISIDASKLKCPRCGGFIKEATYGIDTKGVLSLSTNCTNGHYCDIEDYLSKRARYYVEIEISEVSYRLLQNTNSKVQASAYEGADGAGLTVLTHRLLPVRVEENNDN